MIRAYRPLSASEIPVLEQSVGAAVRAWWPRWSQVGGIEASAIRPLHGDDLAPFEESGRWLSLQGPDATWGAFWLSAGAARSLAELMLDPDPVSAVESGHALVVGLVDRSLADLAHGLMRHAISLSSSAEAPVAGAFVPGAGDACFDLQLGRARITVLMSRGFVDRILGKTGALALRRTQALAPRWQVIQKGAVRLEVRLQDTGLSVADVRRLRRDDVVMFDHRITRPLQVRMQSGINAGACFLGRHEKRRAIKLVKKEGNNS